MDQLIEILKYIILGIIQGITEIFPISSSGHLTIFSRLFHMDMSSFSIFLMITNTGSFLALLYFFRKDVGQLIKGTFCYLIKKDETGKEDFIYVLKLIIAVIPIGIVGLLIKDYLPDDLLSVGFALLLTAGLLFYVYKQKRYPMEKRSYLEKMHSLLVLSKCLLYFLVFQEVVLPYQVVSLKKLN